MQTQAQQPDWPAHIAQWRSSKLTRMAYCRQHGLKFATFIYQIKRGRERRATSLTLVPVKVCAAVAASDGELVLRGAKGWSLAMAGDVSATWLSELLGRLS